MLAIRLFVGLLKIQPVRWCLKSYCAQLSWRQNYNKQAQECVKKNKKNIPEEFCVCLCMCGLAVLHMHCIQSDGVIWTDRQYPVLSESPGTTRATHWQRGWQFLMLCFCVYVAWRPNSQWPHGVDHWPSARMHGRGTRGLMGDTWEIFTPCPLHHVWKQNLTIHVRFTAKWRLSEI